VPQQELREVMTRPQDVLAEVLAQPQQVAHGLFIEWRDADEGELAGAVKAASLRASRRSVFTRSPGRRGVSAGAMTAQSTPSERSCRCSSYPHGPAS
jgi:crotonobetainyl-CoA:carnitine CoA-transferase CaiB-like acyl-CoA transferase